MGVNEANLFPKLLLTVGQLHLLVTERFLGYRHLLSPERSEQGVLLSLLFSLLKKYHKAQTGRCRRKFYLMRACLTHTTMTLPLKCKAQIRNDISGASRRHLQPLIFHVGGPNPQSLTHAGKVLCTELHPSAEIISGMVVHTWIPALRTQEA